MENKGSKTSKVEIVHVKMILTWEMKRRRKMKILKRKVSPRTLQKKL